MTQYIAENHNKSISSCQINKILIDDFSDKSCHRQTLRSNVALTTRAVPKLTEIKSNTVNHGKLIKTFSLLSQMTTKYKNQN